MRSPVIEAVAATKHFGDEVAVDGLDLAVEPGTILGLIGPSGSGKTTTVRLITGVHAPTAGEVRTFGQPPTRLRAADRARIGYMPQQSVLLPDLSVQENLSFAASLYGMSWRRRKRLNAALELVDLTAHRRKRLRDTSGGMQRRLALAATLVHEPELLVLDEPTAGIDPILRQRFWQRFAELRDQGRTVLVCTQYVGEAGYCDAIAILSDGRLLLVDSPEGVRRRAYGGDVIELTATAALPDQVVADLRRLEPVRSVSEAEDDRSLRLVVDDDETAMVAVQRHLGDRGVELVAIQPVVAGFDEVFVRVVEAARRQDGLAQERPISEPAP